MLKLISLYIGNIRSRRLFQIKLWVSLISITRITYNLGIFAYLLLFFISITWIDFRNWEVSWNSTPCFQFTSPRNYIYKYITLTVLPNWIRNKFSKKYVLDFFYYVRLSPRNFYFNGYWHKTSRLKTIPNKKQIKFQYSNIFKEYLMVKFEEQNPIVAWISSGRLVVVAKWFEYKSFVLLWNSVSVLWKSKKTNILKNDWSL